MADTVFAFGQNGSFYLETPSSWNSYKLPSGMKALFDAKKIAATYCVVLAAKDAWMCSYKGNDGLDHLISHGLPPQLKSWLYEKDDDGTLKRVLSKLQVSIGPNNTAFWATDGTDARWLNVPTELNTALKAHGAGMWPAEETPRLVTIGAHDNFLLIREGNGGSWSLGHYPLIRACVEMMRDEIGSLEAVTNAYLNPHRLTHGILQSITGALVTDGTPSWPASLEETISEVKTRIQQDTETKQKEQELKELHESRIETQRRQRQQMEDIQTQLAMMRLQQTINFNNAMAAASLANMANMSNMWNW